MQPPQPPQRSPQRWIIWGVVIVVAAGLLTLLIVRISKLGQDIGEKMAKGGSQALHVLDSVMSVQQDTARYNKLYAQLGDDTAMADTKKRLEHFQQLSDELYDELADLRRRFADTVESTKANKLLDKRISNRFFIRSGRAEKLKRQIISYRRQAIHELPPEADTTGLSMFTMLEEPKNMPSLLRKLARWETMNFDQPPHTVFMNIDRIRWEITLFENSVLNSYSGVTGNRAYSRADSISAFVP